MARLMVMTGRGIFAVILGTRCGFPDAPRPISFLDVRAETFAPVTRVGIERYAGTVDSGDWHRFLGVIYRNAKIGDRLQSPIDERRIRLRIDDGRRVWWVDAEGRFAGRRRFGAIPKRDLHLWNDRLLLAFRIAASGDRNR